MPRPSGKRQKTTCHADTTKTKGIVLPDPFRFEWKIERFFDDCEKVGDSYKSPMFSIPCTDKVTNWHLEVYPKGIEEHPDRTGLYVHLECKDNIKITVDFRLALLNGEGAVAVKEDKESFTFEGPFDSFGWGDYIEQDFIKDLVNNVLVNGTLTIAFEIKFQVGHPRVIQNFQGYDKWLAKIGEGDTDYEKLLDNSNYSDISFVVADKKINGHKAILSLKSPVLASTFQDDMQRRSVIYVTDVDYDILKEMFRFIYSKKVRNIEQIARKLLIAADKYKVMELKALCEKSLYDQLTVDNAVEYLKFTETCNTIHLRRLVIQFIGNNLKNIIEKPGFADLKNTVMLEIFKAISK